MKGLPTLIRLRRQDLDQKRRALVDLEQRESEVERDLLALDNEVTHEQMVAGSAPEFRFAYENFSTAAQARRSKLVASLAELRTELEVAREGVAEAFREYKKYDIAEQNDRRRRREARDRVERIEADELGIEIHQRARR